MMVGQNICPEQLLSIAERTIIEADTGTKNSQFENKKFSKLKDIKMYTQCLI